MKTENYMKKILQKSMPYLLAGLSLFGSIKETNAEIPQDRTVAHIRLELEAENSQAYLKYLDGFLERANTHLKPLNENNEEEAVERLREIYFFIKKEGFSYQPQKHLRDGIKERKIDCDLYSILYESIAEKKGFPIEVLMTPNHSIVRWKLNDGKYITWETTSGYEYPEGKLLESMNDYEIMNGLKPCKEEDIMPITSKEAYIDWMLDGPADHVRNNTEILKDNFPEYAKSMEKFYQKKIDANPRDQNSRMKLEYLVK